MAKNRPLWLALTALMIVSLLAGCFPDLNQGPANSPPANAPVPLRTPAASTGGEEEALPPLPDLPSAPTPAPPYPIPSGSRVTRTGQVITGAAVSVGAITVEAGKPAHLSINNPQNPLYGLEISVPEESYRNAMEYVISYAPITRASFNNVNPVSPLITVENGGGYADQLMTVKVPVKLTADDFAMGFYYDARTGQLEGMPLISQDAQSVTVATRHFSSFFISAMKLLALDAAIMNGDIDSGFRPGKDDWQFINRGSYIEPGGHCAGQSMTALWYYVTRPDGRGTNLWETYDRNGLKPGTPNIWQDDSQPYRFASVVQRDIDWEGWQNKLFNKMAGKSDPLTLRAFAYAMYVTGEPQYVGIRSSKGGGHALVGYRLKKNTEYNVVELFVADPNLPGNGKRTIDYDLDDGEFLAYDAAANAEEPSYYFETIRYVAKTAIVNWNIINAHWKDLKSGEAGDTLFPDYNFRYLDEKGNGQNYIEGMTFAQPNLYIVPLINGRQASAYYFLDGKGINFENKDYKGIALKPGRNIIGVAVFGMPDPTTKKWKYVDYTTLDVTRIILAIDPTVIRAQVNQDCIFSASLPDPPPGVRYDWLVNGTRQQTGPSITFKYRSAIAGTFDIVLKVYDSTGKEMGMTSASAIISGPTATASPSPRPTATPTPTATAKPTPTPTAAPASSARLAYLQAQKTFCAYLIGGEPTYLQKTAGESDRRVTQSMSYPTGFSENPVNITWSGTSFMGSGSFTAAGQTWSSSCQGQVSADGNTLVSLAWSTTLKETNGGSRAFKASSSNVSLEGIWGGGNVQVNNSVSVPRNEAPAKLKIDSDVVTTVSASKVTTTKTWVSMDWSGGGTPGFVLWWGPIP